MFCSSLIGYFAFTERSTPQTLEEIEIWKGSLKDRRFTDEYILKTRHRRPSILSRKDVEGWTAEINTRYMLLEWEPFGNNQGYLSRLGRKMKGR